MSGAGENSIVERMAREMLDRDGAEARGIARERAELDEQLGDRRSAAKWFFISEEIDRLQKSGAAPDTKQR